MQVRQHVDTHLSSNDEVMANLVRRFGPCRLQGGDGGFSALASMVIGQQLSRAAAQTIRTRVITTLEGSLTPEPVLAASEEALKKCGLSSRKVTYLRRMASMTLSGTLNFQQLHTLDDEAAIMALTTVNGVGRWTAEMYLIFVLGRADILPLDDVALRGAFCTLYGVPKEDFADAFRAAGQRWAPYRSIACWYLYAFANGDGAPLPGLNT